MSPGVARLPLVLVLLTLSCGTLPVAPRESIEVTGTTTDRDGAPLDGVTVSFTTLSEEYLSHQVITGSDGTFRISLPTGRHRIYLRRDGFIPRMAEATFSSSNRRFDYQFEGVLISGTMFGPGGAILERVLVDVRGPIGDAFSFQDSVYSILVPPGCYSMRFQFSDFPSGIPAITLSPVCVVRDTTIDVTLDGHVVSGRVTGRGGGTVGTVDVSAFGADGSIVARSATQSDGAYSLRLPTGHYSFLARPVDSIFIAPHSLDLMPVSGPRTLDWDFTGVEWTGVARRATTLDPVPSANISVQRMGSFGWAVAVADANGAFRLIVQPNAAYVIQANGPDVYARVSGVVAGADSTLDLLLSGPYDARRWPRSSGWTDRQVLARPH